MTKVLFVCLGNICRSPTAHGVFQAMVDEHGLSDRVHIESAGTAAYHVGNPPDSRSSAFARKRGYDLTSLRARQAVESDFYEYDFILAMDESNLMNLRALEPQGFKGHLGLFLEFTSMPESEVPDPYYGGDNGFEHVLDLIESASLGLLERIKRDLG